MTNINKEAGSDHPAGIFVPFGRYFGFNPDPAKLPIIFTGENAAEKNQTFWTTVGSTVSLTTLLGTISLLATKYAERKWDKKKADIHRNKVNALYSYNTPNTAPDVKAVKEVRELGISKEDDEDNKKVVEDAAAATEALPKAASLAATLVPPLIALPAAFAIQSAFSQDLVDSRRDKLDEEIAKQRNKLDKLYARLLKLQSEDKDIKKEAADEGSSAPPTSWWWNPFKWAAGKDPGGDKPLGLYLTGLGLFTSAMAYAGYYYTKKNDSNRQKLKVLQEHVLPQNLTNVPASMDVLVGASGKIPTKRAEQTYIKELQNKAKEL